jgi:hypothetical protein
MFVNRLDAVNELVRYVNNIFAVNPIAEQFNLSGLNAQDPEPNFKLGEYDQAVSTELELAYIDTISLPVGYRVLVKTDTVQNGLWVLYVLSDTKEWFIDRVQSYKTSIYWNYANWYADGYSAATRPDFSVETTVDAIKLQATPGIVIFIKNATGNNTWQLVVVDVDSTLSVVGIQNGTIQLEDTLGDYVNNSLGFGNQDFDSNRYDQNPNNEIRAIVLALYNDIFKNTLQGEFNNLFFVLVNYLLTEQVYVDWLFKSSFISITHKLRTLSQFPSYVVDNQTYYQNYIEEVKPYRTKIREYLLDYRGDDTFGGDVTDFDLPAYYDTFGTTPMFRSPSGEAPYQAQDQSTWQTWPYNQWYNNRNLQVFKILIENAGANYAVPPIVTITSADGNGTGANAIALIDGNTGSISNIAVTSSGSGFTSTPIVTINGSATTPGKAYAVMYNPQVRTFDSKLKFDRINYISNVKVWTANTSYVQTAFNANGRVSSGDIITYAFQDGNVMIRQAYFVNANITTTTQFIPSDYTVCPPSYFDNANDRIIGYYEPGNTMPVVDTIRTAVTVANTAANTNTIYVYNADSLSKNMYIGESGVTAGYVTNILSNINLQVNSLGYFYGNLSNNSTAIENITNMANLQVGQYVTGANIGYETTIVSVNYTTNSVNLTDAISGNATLANISFGGIPIKVTQVSLSTNVTLATDTTIYARYDSLEQLVPGVTYPTAVTQSVSFKLNPLFGRSWDIAPFDPVQFSKDGIALLSTSVYDQALYSLYANLTLGTAPEDIITQGGQFVDTYHSRAPEELIPGRTYDTLDMRVYTKVNPVLVDGVPLTPSLGYRIFNNMIDQPSYLHIGFANSTVLTQQLNLADTDIYVANVRALTQPSLMTNTPGVIFIDAERITFWTANIAANTLGQIRRGTQGTAAAIHGTGAVAFDSGPAQLIPGTTQGNVYTNANIWYNAGSGTAVDGLGTEGSTTTATKFLKAYPAFYGNIIIGANNPIVTEGMINITTEDGNEIYTED